MATTASRLLLAILILCILTSFCRGTYLFGVSEAVHRYAKHHFKRNWEKRVDEIRLSSTHEGASFVYLPHEVILMKQAVSKKEQIQLFSHFAPFIKADGRQADQSLCAKDRFTLFNSTMTDQKDENLQKLGSTLFLETAEQLANIQNVKPGYTDQKFQMDIEKKPRFLALHGVWYNENGYLRSHQDRTWDQDNKTSQTEWVFSISLGSTTRFTYHHPHDIQGNHSTTVLVESGDVLLFNGAYLYHGVQVLEHSIPNWWEKELSNLQGRFNLQYRVLTGNSRYSEKHKSNEDERIVLQEKTAKKNEPSQHREKCLKVPESSGRPSTVPDDIWLKRVEDKPRTDRDNAWLMRVEDKPSTDRNNAWLMRVEDKPSTDRNNAWLMRVEDKPSTDRNNAWLMRVEDKPSTDRNNAWLMRVEDKPSTDGDNAWLMRVEDKPSTDRDNAWLMRVEDKPSTDRDNAWLMRVEDKHSTDRDNAWLMRVEDKPSTDRDNAWLMRVEDKPSTDRDNAWLMRVEDKPSTDRDNAWLMRVEDKPSTSSSDLRCLPKQSYERIPETTSWLPLVNDIYEDVTGNPGFLDFEVFPKHGFPKTLFRQFWCFNYTINKDHQRRAIWALGGNGNTNDVKKDFYEKLKLIQGLNIPVHERNIVLSFENSDVVESMYKTGLLVNPKKFILNGNHIFSKKEQQEISKKTAQALEFIRQADSDLYESMLQVVACVGYYKAAEKGHLGGTVSSAVGLIWLDPSKGGDWSIPFLAEQLVHEYIHTTLFIAEMVRGTYTDPLLVQKALVVSAIRRQKRGYDKSFHAAYVATGLVAFHAYTGSSGRASELSKYLNQSVHDLEKVQLKTDVLDETGAVMLLHLKTFLHKAKVM